MGLTTKGRFDGMGKYGDMLVAIRALDDRAHAVSLSEAEYAPTENDLSDISDAADRVADAVKAVTGNVAAPAEKSPTSSRSAAK